MEEELGTVLKKIRNSKAASLDEIPQEVWKTKKFDDILHQICNTVYEQNSIEKWTKKDDFRITKNYRGINLTGIVAKVYNSLLLNHIQSKITKILRRNQNGF